jgi:hypothetical protein
MSLKFKRNLPTILLLAAFVTSLALFLGNQPVIAYTVSVDAPSGVQAAALSADTAADSSLPKETAGTQTNPLLETE